MLTNDFHTDKKKIAHKEALSLPWPTVLSGPLSLLHSIKFNLSLVELVCDYKWAGGVTLHSQSGWKGTERRREEHWGEERDCDVTCRMGKQSESCVFKMVPR